MTEGAIAAPSRIPVAIVDVVTQRWCVVPGKSGAPGIAVSCPKCPPEAYFGMFRTGGVRTRPCPNCGSYLMPGGGRLMNDQSTRG